MRNKSNLFGLSILIGTHIILPILFTFYALEYGVAWPIYFILIYLVVWFIGEFYIYDLENNKSFMNWKGFFPLLAFIIPAIILSFSDNVGILVAMYDSDGSKYNVVISKSSSKKLEYGGKYIIERQYFPKSNTDSLIFLYDYNPSDTLGLGLRYYNINTSNFLEYSSVYKNEFDSVTMQMLEGYRKSQLKYMHVDSYLILEYRREEH